MNAKALTLIAVPSAVLLLAACGASHPAAPSPATVPSPVPVVTSQAPDPEVTVCEQFRADLPGILYWLEHPSLTPLLHYESVLGAMSTTVLDEYSDATFANYLSDAAVAVGTTGAPGGSAYAATAAADLGEVNGYCEYDVGVAMSYVPSQGAS